MISIQEAGFSEIWNLGIPCLNSSISYITFIKGWKSRQTIMSVFPFEGLAIKLVNQLADLIDASFFEESYTFFHLPISRTDINENPVLSYTI